MLFNLIIENIPEKSSVFKKKNYKHKAQLVPTSSCLPKQNLSIILSYHKKIYTFGCWLASEFWFGSEHWSHVWALSNTFRNSFNLWSLIKYDGDSGRKIDFFQTPPLPWRQRHSNYKGAIRKQHKLFFTFPPLNV